MSPPFPFAIIMWKDLSHHHVPHTFYGSIPLNFAELSTLNWAYNNTTISWKDWSRVFWWERMHRSFSSKMCAGIYPEDSKFPHVTASKSNIVLTAKTSTSGESKRNLDIKGITKYSPHTKQSYGLAYLDSLPSSAEIISSTCPISLHLASSSRASLTCCSLQQCTWRGYNHKPCTLDTAQTSSKQWRHIFLSHVTSPQDNDFTPMISLIDHLFSSSPPAADSIKYFIPKP